MTKLKRYMGAICMVIIKLFLMSFLLHLYMHYVFGTTPKEGQLALVLVLGLMVRKELT